MRMKKILAISLFFSAAAFAESFNGTIVDSMCKGKDPAAHTAKCAIGCAKSGFVLVTPDGKTLKLDESGNAKALTALKETKKEKDLKATVNGSVDGETLKVDSITLD